MVETYEERFFGFDFSSNGFFYDDAGNLISLFGVHEFDNFWREFESLIESPIGRKLIYAAADQEELVIMNSSSYAAGKWFWKKRVTQALLKRSSTMGWGKISGTTISSPCHDYFCVGVSLAHFEHLTQRRWSVQWQQKHADSIELDFEPQSRELHSPQLPKRPEWGVRLMRETVANPLILDLDLRSFGFFAGEERSFFLPVTMFQFLWSPSLGKVRSELLYQQKGVSFANSGTHHELFLAICTAAKVAFQASELPVYVLKPEDWKNLIHQRITRRGLGTVFVHSMLNSPGDISTHFTIESPLPAYVSGLLIGLWERAFGRRADTSICVKNDAVDLSIQAQSVNYEHEQKN